MSSSAHILQWLPSFSEEKPEPQSDPCISPLQLCRPHLTGTLPPSGFGTFYSLCLECSSPRQPCGWHLVIGLNVPSLSEAFLATFDLILNSPLCVHTHTHTHGFLQSYSVLDQHTTVPNSAPLPARVIVSTEYPHLVLLATSKVIVVIPVLHLRKVQTGSGLAGEFHMRMAGS